MARLVRLLQAQQGQCLCPNRQVHTRQVAQHPAQALRRLRPRSGPRSSALAQGLLPRPRLALPESLPSGASSTSLRSTLPTGEPDAGNPPVRFGRGGASIPSLSHQPETTLGSRSPEMKNHQPASRIRGRNAPKTKLVPECSGCVHS